MRRDSQAVRLAEIHQLFERRATGQKFFRHEGHALAWFFSERSRKMAPRALPLERFANAGGSSTPRVRDDNRNDAYATVLLAIQAAVDDAGKDGHAHELAHWITEHHAKGRAYHWIVDDGGAFTVDQMKRRMSRAHRIIREELTRKGFIEARSTSA